MVDESLVALAALILGGAELRYAVHRLSKRQRIVESRMARLEFDRTPPTLVDPSSGNRPAIGRDGRFHLVVAMLALLLPFIGGCTQAQVDRASQLVAAADAKLAAAQHAQQEAQATLDEAKALAAQTNSAIAQQAVAKAQTALTASSSIVDTATATDAAAHQALDGAKAAQAAGGGTVDVVLGAVTALIPGVGGILAALAQARRASTAFAQTVRGLDSARVSMGDATWDQHVAPHLAAAQDASVKAAVAAVQGTKA